MYTRNFSSNDNNTKVRRNELSYDFFVSVGCKKDEGI